MGFGFDGHSTNNQDLGAGSDANASLRDQQRQIEQGNRFTFGGHMGVDANGNPDPNATNSANTEAWRYQNMGGDWARMGAPTINYGQANGYMGMGDAARMQQAQALGLQQSAAMGNAPSAAASMMGMGNAQAMRNQMAMAANARGAGGMGVAGFQAANNMGQLQGQNIAQTGQLRAQEMAQARDAYMQGASGMRGQDYAAAGMTGGWAQNQAALEMQQRQLGLQGQLGFEQLGYNVNDAQLRAQMQLESAQQGHWQAQSNLDAASQRASDANTWKGVSLGAGAVGGGMGGSSYGGM